MPARQTLEQHLAADRAQIDQRRRLGDRLSAPREVEHFAYFSRKSSAHDAGAVLTAQGLRVEIRRSGLRTLVIVRQESDVEPATVEKTTRTLYEIIESRGGIYDGWGGTIVPAR